MDFISKSFFVLLYPVFFVYHILVSQGIIPAFLGGLFGPLCVVYFIFFIVFYLKRLSAGYKADKNYFLIVVITLFLFLFFTIYNYAFNFAWYVGAASMQAFESIVLIASLFFLSLSLDISSDKYQRFLQVFLLFIFMYLIFYLYSTGNIMFSAVGEDSDSEQSSTYQGLARSIFMLLIVLISFIKSGLKSHLIGIIGAFCLFLVGARSELYIFIALYVFSSVLVDISAKKIIYSSILFFIATYYIVLNFDELSQSRQFQIFDLDDSTSWNSRKELADIALRQISENPFFGFFGGHVLEKSTGQYAHNSLSAWVNYGFISFVFYNLTMLYPIIVLLKKNFLSKERLSDNARFALFCNISALLLTASAKPVFWPTVAFGWGSYLVYKIKRMEH